MTEQQKIGEIISLLTFLQRYINNNVLNSFTDLTFSLENMIKDYLNVFENNEDKFENINKFQHNYPAIDLVNNAKNLAIQVTTNADFKKVNKTIETYKKHNLNYSKLIIVGFVKNTKRTIPNIEIHGLDYLVDLMKHGSASQKDQLYVILKNHIPWNILTPLDDKMCYDVVFDVINRSAVRDHTICEGDYDRMVDGLDEIKQIITTGLIKGKNIRSKSLVEYSTSIKKELSDIEFYVSSIIQICNMNKNKRDSTFICLDYDEKNAIDDLKEKIIQLANSLGTKLQLGKKIIGSKRF